MVDAGRLAGARHLCGLAALHAHGVLCGGDGPDEARPPRAAEMAGAADPRPVRGRGGHFLSGMEFGAWLACLSGVSRNRSTYVLPAFHSRAACDVAAAARGIWMGAREERDQAADGIRRGIPLRIRMAFGLARRAVVDGAALAAMRLWRMDRSGGDAAGPSHDERAAAHPTRDVVP